MGTNNSKLINIRFTKNGETNTCWTMDLKHKHGVIIVEAEGEIQFIPAAGQFFSANKWKPHPDCKNPTFPKSFDPSKNKKEKHNMYMKHTNKKLSVPSSEMWYKKK